MYLRLPDVSLSIEKARAKTRAFYPIALHTETAASAIVHPAIASTYFIHTLYIQNIYYLYIAVAPAVVPIRFRGWPRRLRMPAGRAVR